jgi:hypothetical protein
MVANVKVSSTWLLQAAAAKLSGAGETFPSGLVIARDSGERSRRLQEALEQMLDEVPLPVFLQPTIDDHRKRQLS